jgi:hypothetical protein
MPVKTKPKAKPKAKKTAKPVRKAAPKKKALPGLECGICGYRVIVDEACGCVVEHVLLCCSKPMAKVAVSK